ncbi:MAG: InlB B-repeat-containing protein, partial [Anaeroplasmataceae bacterium]|nr:InlB B-repeat-containing protein [Anaeroplasmataceae bacterium]
TAISVDYLGTITKPANPSKTGYTFKGWSTLKNSYAAYDFTKQVTSDLTLYAFFDINSYTITFDVDNETSTISVDYLGTVTKPANPSKTGYTFKAWYFNGKEFNFSTPITADITLVAQFEINSYTISFDVDGVITTATVDYLGTVTKPANPSKTGHTFKAWYFNGKEFNFSTPITADITLVAQFEAEKYTITFMVDNETYHTLQVSYGSKATKPKDPTKDGSLFIEWLLDGNTFDFNTNITSNLTLTASFDTLNQYTVTFKVNNTVYDTQTVYENGLVTPPTDPTHETLHFVGWFLEDDTSYDFKTPVLEDLVLIAHFEETVLNITSSSGYTEGLYIEFDKINDLSLSDYAISYKLSSDNSFKNADSQLIREKGNTIRCDIVGLPAGSYDVKITAGSKSMNKNFTVTADDRSGYAHFGNTTGVGAYNNDGSLKSNAVVVYVSDETKNTVTAQIGGKTYTGLSAIIKACTKSSYALDIRILGEIQTTQWNFKEHGTGNTSARQQNLENAFNYVNDTSKWDEKSSSNYSKLNAEDIISKGINSMSSDIAKGITKLEGLTNQVLRNKKADSKTGAYEYDSYYNMLDVAGAYNITIEGIGTDAAIFQWGFAFKKCNSIEIKNIRFYNYTEDAVGFEGASNSDTNYGYYWVHNCTFDLGVNNWDVCYENDKKDGDGSTDVKYCHNVTISYVQYNKTHKTNLIGSSDSALQYNITLHHNYYNNCGSRLPLVRQTNIHMYNNYYYKSSSYSNSIRANCYALVENCYYEGGQNPYETQSNGAIKAYNNIYTSDVKISNSTYKKENTVSSRTQTVSNTCKPDGSTDYSDFDMNPNLFYYDATNKVSKVKNMLAPGDVPQHCKTYSGTLKANAKGLPDSSGGGSQITPIDPDPIIPTGDKVVLSFNDFATASISSTTTVSGLTILPKSGKTAEIKALKSAQTIASTSVSKYIAFGGAGSFNDLSAKFTTTKKANITVYYDSSTAGRYAQLCSDSISTKAETATVSGEVVSYTFTNQEAGTYSVCSYNSSLNIYLIVIEYLE